MRLKKKLIPSFDLELSNLEATAALHMARAATGVIANKGSLGPYDKAALALAKTLEQALMSQGAKNKLPDIEEAYPAARQPKRQLREAPPQEPDVTEDLEQQLEELLEEDEDVV